MKKIIALLFILAIVKVSSAQSFSKGDKNIDIKLDYGNYSGIMTQNDSSKKTPPSQKFDVSAIVISPQIEWATGKRISLGGGLAISSYSHFPDSIVTGAGAATAAGLDLNFVFNFHFLRKTKLDVMAGVKAGLAGIRMSPNDGTGDIYGNTGGVFELHCTARYCVSDRIRIIANLGLPIYDHGQFGKNLIDTYSVSYSGFLIGTGISIRIGKRKEPGADGAKDKGARAPAPAPKPAGDYK